MHLVALRSPVFHFRVLASSLLLHWSSREVYRGIRQWKTEAQSAGGFELSRDDSRSRLHINQPLVRAKKVEKSFNEF